MGVGVCVFASVSVCARRACMHACVRDVFAIYDNDILPMLIMIIINIIILYFIQIRHTDDFRSTGTGLVIIMFEKVHLFLCKYFVYKKLLFNPAFLN